MYTPGPWQVVRTAGGFQIARIWSSGLYQRQRESYGTEAEARARINNSLTSKPLMIPKFTLAPLPVFKLQPLPFEPDYSPWFPLTKNPWQWGEYEIKSHTSTITATGNRQMVEVIAKRRYLWDGREWADKLPAAAIAWRGLAKPPEVA